MKVLVTGATGFIGKPLVHELLKAGHHVVALSRSLEAAIEELPKGCEVYAWDPEEDNIPISSMVGIEAVINLSGENIGQYWTEEVKKRIYNSRVFGTRKLVKLLKQSPFPLKVFIQASAIGFYSDHDTDEFYFETSPAGHSFLSHVCLEWEKEIDPLHDSVRKVILRFGLVLEDGGVLKSMLLPFKLGLGAVIGNGKQWMSWIHRKDLIAAIIHTLNHPEMSGPYNLVAPHPVTNREFTKMLSKVLVRPSFLFVPKLVLKSVLQDFSTLLTNGQRVSSEKLLKTGFKFHFSTLEEALIDILKR